MRFSVRVCARARACVRRTTKRTRSVYHRESKVGVSFAFRSVAHGRLLCEQATLCKSYEVRVVNADTMTERGGQGKVPPRHVCHLLCQITTQTAMLVMMNHNNTFISLFLFCDTSG